MSFVPTERLLWLVFAAALLAVGAGPWPEFQPAWLISLVVLTLAAIGDAIGALAGTRAPRPAVPGVLRFLRDRAGTIPVTFANSGGRARRLSFALGLPGEFISTDDRIRVDLPAGAPRARVDWKVTPRQRGRFGGVLAVVETDSFLGLWQVRTRSELPCELRVYPNLLAERRNVAAILLARGDAGTRVQRTLGRGREFEKLRDYLPGDDFGEIHWKATAKRNRPVTKVFQAERTQEIYVAVDASRLSARPVRRDGIEQTALERCLTSALLLLAAAEKQGDRFGFIGYDDRVRVFVGAGTGAEHYAACREAMLGLRPSESAPDMAEIFGHLRLRLRRRALLFFLSDLTDPVLAEDFARHVRVLARQHLIIAGQLQAPEIAPLFRGAPVTAADDVYERLAGHARWAESRALGQRLKPLGVTALPLADETMAAQLIARYFEVKRRQAL